MFLLLDRLYGGDLPSLPALAYGNIHEQCGIDAYVSWHAAQGSTVTVKSAGLHVMDYGFLGCSPDGLVYEHATGESGVVDIKCPSSAAAAVSLVEVAKKSNHFAPK